MHRRRLIVCTSFVGVLAFSRVAAAQVADGSDAGVPLPPPLPAPVAAPAAVPPAADAGTAEVLSPPPPALPALPAPPPPPSPSPTKLAASVAPRPKSKSAASEPSATSRFIVDPVADGATLGLGIGFAGLSEALLSTGEIRPQQIRSSFDSKHLLFLDRGAISQKVDPSAGALSTVGVLTVVGFAVVDPFLSAWREDTKRAALVDGTIYAETLSLTWGLTNLVKVAVRRPRPSAYMEAAQHANDPNYEITDSNASLSFFSGHTAITASVTATATYLAFARSPHTARPWVTLLAGSLVTGFVGVERVRSGAHFPTDVIAGAMAGAGVGLLVPHLHRYDTARQRAIWIGYAPAGTHGGAATLSGLF